jgi:hypothetical protein
MSDEALRQKRIGRNMGIVGIIGLALSAIGAFMEPKQFFFSYLFGYLLWLGLALGCFVVTMLHHLTGGRWGFPTRRFLEAGFWTLPVMAILFIPIFFGLNQLYPWARADLTGVVAKKAAYMNEGWFIARVIFYFAVWIVIAWNLRRWSLEQDGTEDPRPTRKLINLSGPGIVILPLTATFAYVDWILSLEKEWYSTVFGVIVLSGQVLAACSFVTVLLALFKGNRGLVKIVSSKHYHQLGNLILAFVLFWTYVSFGQLLIIYSGNLPDEISWYLHRIAGGWKYVIGAAALFNFFLPFFLLLFRAFKTHLEILKSIAVVLLVMYALVVYWMITPSLHPKGLEISWLDFTAPIGVGGIWLACFLRGLARAPLIPANDPRLKMELLRER